MTDRIPMKFENTAEIGDTIKAFDHQPRPGVDCWVMGVVEAKGIIQPEGFRAYTILVTQDSHDGSRVGDTVFVPFGVSPLDYDGRVTLVSRRPPIPESAEERARLEGTDPIDEAAADQDHADEFRFAGIVAAGLAEPFR